MWVLWHDVVVPQVSPPFETAEFDIMYGDGINALGCVFDVAKDLDVLEARVSGGRAGHTLAASCARLSAEECCTAAAAVSREQWCMFGDV
jgi:hypothetical protein